MERAVRARDANARLDIAARFVSSPNKDLACNVTATYIYRTIRKQTLISTKSRLKDAPINASRGRAGDKLIASQSYFPARIWDVQR